jgi:DNA-directed RNA polymerase subunit RPC12/RpoP
VNRKTPIERVISCFACGRPIEVPANRKLVDCPHCHERLDLSSKLLPEKPTEAPPQKPQVVRWKVSFNTPEAQQIWMGIQCLARLEGISATELLERYVKRGLQAPRRKPLDSLDAEPWYSLKRPSQERHTPATCPHPIHRIGVPLTPMQERAWDAFLQASPEERRKKFPGYRLPTPQERRKMERYIEERLRDLKALEAFQQLAKHFLGKSEDPPPET